MSGSLPKSPELRQRTNKVSTAATLEGKPVRRMPSLPSDFEWHSRTKSDWKRWWKSPMASQWTEGDLPALFRLADLVDRYWWAAETAKTANQKQLAILDTETKFTRQAISKLLSLAAEIRQQEARFGLSPIDRWRLQWKVEEDLGARRYDDEAQEPEEDPRTALRMIVGGQ